MCLLTTSALGCPRTARNWDSLVTTSSKRASMATSIRADTGVCDQLAPARVLFLHEAREFARRGGRRFEAHVHVRRPDLGQRQHADDVGVELVQDRAGRT